MQYTKSSQGWWDPTKQLLPLFSLCAPFNLGAQFKLSIVRLIPNVMDNDPMIEFLLLWCLCFYLVCRILVVGNIFQLLWPPKNTRRLFTSGIGSHVHRLVFLLVWWGYANDDQQIVLDLSVLSIYAPRCCHCQFDPI